jgi:outer membrane receptor for ferrienterochelin and colicins
LVDAYKTSDSFTEINLKLSYTFFLESVDSGIELFGGVRNILIAYQSDFDTGKNRDSNYVYGPGAPRTIFFGVRIKSL